MDTVKTIKQERRLADFTNPLLPVEHRVTDLLTRMTIEEKLAQLTGLWPTDLEACKDFFLGTGLFSDEGTLVPEKAERFLKNGTGHIVTTLMFRSPAGYARAVNALQRHLLDNTRLGIPALVIAEGLHGCWLDDATVFPQAIALASTWNPALVESVFNAVAAEARSRGIVQVLSPVLDVARDPRWGRTEETYGEDPYLVSRMAVACARGLQGAGETIDRHHVAATLKHFAAYGQPEDGTNCAPANYSERTIREVFLPPFEAAIREACARCVMPSYNEIDGVPSHANKWLLQTILRGEWKFEGLVVSDYEGINRLYHAHRLAGDLPGAAMLALESGVDCEVAKNQCFSTLKAQALEGVLSESLLDEAVKRVLRLKFELGLFEHPWADEEAAEELSCSASHRSMALCAAREAIILLKNDNHLLPLDRTKLRRIALIGPNAGKVRLGGYSGKPREAIDVLRGLLDKLGDAIEITYAEGCRIIEPDPILGPMGDLVAPDEEEDTLRITEAAEVARMVDVAVLCLGGNEVTCRESVPFEGKWIGDRANLDLFGRQDDLVKAVFGTGTPTIVILFAGRPNAINYISENVPAILQCWYLGQETGHAVADVLFGDYNPAGRLPITIPRSAGHLPCYYNHKPTARQGYVLDSSAPIYSFGHGLSYTQFTYSDLTISPAEARPDEAAVISVKITNTGTMAGDEVVQLYIRDRVSTVTRPVRELKDFRRIHIESGESKVVTFVLPLEKLALWDINMKYTTEPGEFDIMVGPNSTELITVELAVRKDA